MVGEEDRDLIADAVQQRKKDLEVAPPEWRQEIIQDIQACEPTHRTAFVSPASIAPARGFLCPVTALKSERPNGRIATSDGWLWPRLERRGLSSCEAALLGRRLSLARSADQLSKKCSRSGRDSIMARARSSRLA